MLSSMTMISRSLLVVLLTLAITGGLHPMPAVMAGPSADDYVVEASNLHNRREYAKAVVLLKKALHLNPHHVRAWSWLGLTYEKMGRPTEAIAAFKKVIELAPRSRDAEAAQLWINRLQQQALPPPVTPMSPASPLPSGPSVRIGKDEPITIGYWLVVEGPDADLGIDSRRGVELAIDDREGRLLGHSIALIGENSGCTPQGGAAAADKLANNRRILAAVGPSCSSEAIPGAPVLWRSGIPTVSPSNTAPRLTDPRREQGYEGYLRVSWNDRAQALRAAEFARRALNVTKAATIHDGSPYGEQLVGTFIDAFQRLGGSITSNHTVRPTDANFRELLRVVATGTPELLYYPIFAAAGSAITRQVRESAGLEGVRTMGADGLFLPDFLRRTGPAVVGTYLSAPDLSVQAMGPRYGDLLTKYRTRFGNPISAFHAHAYDAAAMIFTAIEKVAVGDGAGGLHVGRKQLREALYNTKNFPGATGTLNCDAYGDCGNPIISIYQVISSDPSTWSPGTNPRRVYP